MFNIRGGRLRGETSIFDRKKGGLEQPNLDHMIFQTILLDQIFKI